MKSIIRLVIAICFVTVTLFAYYQKDNASIFFNGERVLLRAPVLIHNNRLCVPVKEFSQKAGLFYEKQGKKIHVKDNSYKKVSFLANHDQVMVNDTKYYMADKTFYSNDVWYVPLGYYAWYLGYTMNRTGSNYYISKRLVGMDATGDSIKLQYACNISNYSAKLVKSVGKYTLSLDDTVLSFPRKTLSNKVASNIVLGQITTKPDLAKLIINSKKELFVRKSALNELTISPKQIADIPVPNKEQYIPEDVEVIKDNKASDKAVWIPSFVNVKNIILSVKGTKLTLPGVAVHRDGKYLVPAEKVLLPFGFEFNVSSVGNLIVKYGDKQEVDTQVKVYNLKNVDYIPLQDLAKKLGIGLRWDYRIHTLFVNPIINNVSFKKSKSGDSIVVSSYAEIEPKEIFALRDPNRIILDIPNAVLDVAKQVLRVKDSNIKLVKVAQFDEETVRVVIQIKRDISYGVSISDDGTRVAVQAAGKINKVWYQPYDKYNLLTIHGSSLGKISWKQTGSKLDIDIPNASYKARDVYYFKDYFLQKIVGSQYSWDPLASRMSIHFKQTPKLTVKQVGDKIKVFIDNSDGKAVYAKKAVIKSQKLAVTSSKPLAGKKIVVEAGHGGADVGAIGIGGKYEKWFTLNTAYKIKEELTARGATVLMPLWKDQYMSLSRRTQFANRNNANLFISVHYNSFVNERAKGSSTFYYSYASKPIARTIQKRIAGSTGFRDNGIKQRRLFVLFHTKMPAVLIEPCFLSNKYEYNMLLKQEVRDRIARAVAEGVVDYYRGK